MVGVNMDNINKIKEIFNSKGKVFFKLLSLEYIIEKKDNVVYIYSPTYPNDTRKYNSIDQLIENFFIYGNNLIDNEDRITNIKEL